MSTDVTLDTGINARIWGADKEVALLLLHGFGEGAFVWNEFATHVSSHFKVVAIDFRGHGRSNWAVDGHYSSELYIRDVQNVISALGLKNLSIVGHSLGGAVALNLAAEAGLDISCLILVDTSPSESLESLEHLKQLFLAEHKIYRTENEYKEFLANSRLLIPENILEHFVKDAIHADPYGSFQLRRDPQVIKLLEESSDELIWRSQLNKLEVPVLLVRGIASAVLTKRDALDLVQYMRRGQLAVIDRAGHAVMTDNPAGFSAAATSFLHKNGLPSANL